MGALFSSPVLSEEWDTTQKPTTDNLSTILRQLAENYSNNSAVVSLHQQGNYSNEHGDRTKQPIRLTFSELHQESLKFAKHLSAKGVTPGTAIVAIFFNQVEWAISFWAAAHLGCQFVPLDPRAFGRKEDAQYLLGKITASAILVSNEDLAIKVDDALSTLQVTPVIRCIANVDQVISPVPGWTGLSDSSDLSENEDASLPKFPRTPQEPAITFFTSGTSGSPKACPQSAINIHAAALGFSNRLRLDSSYSVCQHLPSFHVFSVVITLSVWLRGGSIIFPSPSFDPSSSIHAIEYGSNVILPCVPLMAQAIAKSPTLLKPFNTLDSIILGGAPVSPEVIELAKSLGAKRVNVGFGMSEGVITLLNVMSAEEAKANVNGDVSLGTVVSGSKVRICAPGSRQPLPRGELGELHQGGLPVFKGYLGISDSSCYHEDGVDFIATGDQAYMDEGGHVYILGRYKDLIIRGGENISPSKIENLLVQATGIAVRSCLPPSIIVAY
jgi:acyl-CoA synthetase (AMP-forming)/AMP-acid ligase II